MMDDQTRLQNNPAARRPVGVYAAILAIGIAIVGAIGGQAYAVGLAGQYLHAVAGQKLPLKWESLTFQRAAFANGHLLPIYGSSELYCCGDPFHATQLFANEPTGFDAFAVGQAGTADLFFMETFAALGSDLHGKKLVISDSPPWFYGRKGIGPKPYAGNFSPEIAEMFAFDAPISLRLREAGARQMLAYPSTLKGQPLLRLAIEDLADPTPLHLAEYVALEPAGWLDAWVHQLQDAGTTVAYIRAHPALAKLNHVKPSPPRQLNWPALARRGTSLAEERDTTNPFGFPNGTYYHFLYAGPAMRHALQLFCSGRTNQNGQVYPYPRGWVQNMEHSAEWTDLSLELQVLHALGARPLVWTIPIPGWYDNFTPISAPARRQYYVKYQQVTTAAGISALEFRAHDEDRYFLTDSGAHFSPRGWIFADRALDLFWHGASTSKIHAALANLDAHAPPVASPKRSLYCKGSGE